VWYCVVLCGRVSPVSLVLLPGTLKKIEKAMEVLKQPASKKETQGNHCGSVSKLGMYNSKCCSEPS
jgi:hypothetical protein